MDSRFTTPPDLRRLEIAPALLWSTSVALLLVVCVVVAGFVRAEKYNPTIAIVPGQFLGTGSGNTEIVTNVTQGTLTVDGKPFAVNSLVSPAGVRHRFDFNQGDNAVSLDAPPFAKVTCHFTVSPTNVTASQDGTLVTNGAAFAANCHTNYSFNVLNMGGPSGDAVAITVGPAQLAQFPSGALTPLMHQAEQQLEQESALQTSVPPQQPYAVKESLNDHNTFPAHIVTHTSSGAVKAVVQMTYTQALDGWANLDALAPQASGKAQDWYLPISNLPQWAFAVSGGSPPVTFRPRQALSNEIYVRLSTNDNHTWTANDDSAGNSAQIRFILCANSFADAPSLIYPAAYYFKDTYFSIAHLSHLNGCTGSMLNESTSLGRFAISFGVVYAIDSTAHKQAPALPVAPSALLRQIDQ